MAKESTGPASPAETAAEDRIIPTTARLRRRNAVSAPRRAGAAGPSGVVGSSPPLRTPAAAMVLVPMRTPTSPRSRPSSPALTPSNMTARPIAVTLLLRLLPIVCDVPCQSEQHKAKVFRLQTCADGIQMEAFPGRPRQGGILKKGWNRRYITRVKRATGSSSYLSPAGGFRSSVMLERRGRRTSGRLEVPDLEIDGGGQAVNL
jgi:hypothetical protein